MHHLPVNWSEGMFLRPHHFQANDRYWAEQLDLNTKWTVPYAYGIRAIEFSKEAIANNQFHLLRLHARMPDGTLVSMEVGQEPDRAPLKEAMQKLQNGEVELNEAFETQESLTVYIGIPKLHLGRANVSPEEEIGRTRYVGTEAETQEETAGGGDVEIGYKALNARLLLSTDDLAGFETLPIAQLERSGEAEATPRVNVKYIPPMLAMDGWDSLRKIAQDIYDMVGRKIEYLAQVVITRGSTLFVQEPGDFDRVLMLTQLNEVHAKMNVLAFSQGLHPYVVFSELSGIVGKLAIFHPDRRIESLPRYDHENLGPTFQRLRDWVEDLINRIGELRYEQRYFVREPNGMRVTLEPKWFGSDWEWVIGVHKGELTVDQCRHLLTSKELNWKLGSERQVEFLYKRRAAGLELREENIPRALPRSVDWLYFKVIQGNVAWQDVMQTQSLAMRLSETLIDSRNQPEDEKKLVLSKAGHQCTLQFAMFAVPISQ